MRTLQILLVVFFAATVLGTALVLLRGEPEDRRTARSPAVWGSLLLLTMIACAGMLWEETSLRRFAQKEGGELRGLIMRPAPLTNDHQFTKNGREYLYRGIQRPTIVTCALLLIVAFSSTVWLYAKDLRRMITAVWLHSIATASAVAAFSV